MQSIMSTMTKKMWEEISDETLERMAEHVEPFLSPIWKFKNKDSEQLHGTGSYIENANDRYIITNEHVAKYNLTNRLTHSFHGSENVFVLTNEFLCEAVPVDVAISKIDNSLWKKHVCQAKGIPMNRFNEKHASINGELLFFAGFSDERSQTVLDTNVSRGTPFLTQECPLPKSIEEAIPKYHISIPYPPELARTKDTSVPLPNPHGFSGSLLWNTKRVECLEKNLEWDPSMAKVTAIIWGWPSSSACILATKVERLKLEEMMCSYDNH